MENNVIKQICIVGKNSYIGNHIQEWIEKKEGDAVSIYQLEAQTDEWKTLDYSQFDAIVQVAGIVHRPDVTDWNLYQRVNVDLPVNIAKKAKEQGVKTFVFLSSMAVFGTPKRLAKNVITADTPTSPIGLYGKSKLMAEQELLKLSDGHFNVCIVRPPNVYGKDCRGGYIPGFVKVVKKLPAIPEAYTEVKQSMLYIDNLTEFIRLAIKQNKHGIFMPQDDKAVSAVDITTAIAKGLGKKPKTSKLLGWCVRLANFVPLIQKAHGGVEYDMQLSRIEGMDYVVVPFNEAMVRTIK